MKIKKLIVGIGFSVLATGFLSPAATLATMSGIKQQPSSERLLLAQATNQAALIAENAGLLTANTALAVKILAKAGGKPPMQTPIPANAAPLVKNQLRILNNRLIFLAIATAVKATVPAIPPRSTTTDVALQNASLLIGNRVIVRAIAMKLGVTLAPPITPIGSGPQQVNTLLKGNRSGLLLLAAKLGVTP